jgi:dienelactone hydrolase
MNAPEHQSLQELQQHPRFSAQAPRADGQLTRFSAYIPAMNESAPPLAVLSHGVGGDCTDLRYLGEALQKAGWVAIVVGHAESGLDVLRQHIDQQGLRMGTRALTMDSQAHQARQLDIGAVLGWVDAYYQPAFRALIGHSMGSGATVIEAGAKNSIGITGKDRFDAYVAMSPEGPGSLFPEKAWSEIRKPVLIMTGTRDRALEGDWQWRTQAFLALPPGRNWLAVIKGAGHFVFSGRGFRFRIRRLAAKTVVAFLDPLRSGQSPSVVQGWGLKITTK